MSAPKIETIAEFTLPMTREQAEAICAKGTEAIIFVMMQVAKLAEQAKDSSASSPSVLSTPSAMIPVFEKPTLPRRRKKPGCAKCIRSDKQSTRAASRWRRGSSLVSFRRIVRM